MISPDEIEAPAESAPPTDAATIERLRKSNRELRMKLKTMAVYYADDLASKGAMSREIFGKIAKCLHPDYAPSEAERVEAFTLFSQWKAGKKAKPGGA